MHIASGASAPGYDLALYRQLQSATQLQGEHALALIAQAAPAAASPTPPPLDPATGRLHLVA